MDVSVHQREKEKIPSSKIVKEHIDGTRLDQNGLREFDVFHL